MEKIFRAKWGFLFISGLLIFTYQNCAYVADSGMAPGGSSVSSLAPDTEGEKSALLEKNAMSVLKGKCFSCHNSQNAMGGIDFITDVNSLKYYRLAIPGEPQISPIYDVIAKGEMPPNAPLSQAQAQAIYDWIFEGMVGDSSGVVPPGGTAGALEPKFQSIFAKIIQPKCLGCHSQALQRGGVNLSTYTATMNTVQPANPGASSFYTSTQMARMPQGSGPLNPSEMTAIRDWITNGALNN